MKLKVVVGLVVLFILGFAVFGERGLFRLLSLQQQKQALALESERLQAENDRLREQVERLQNDHLYVERFAREELGMVKPGEFVLQFEESREPRPGAL